MNISKFKQQLLSGSERSKESSFKFIRHELPTRMLNITQEFSSIPLDFSPMVQTVIDMYDESINDILPYTQGWGLILELIIYPRTVNLIFTYFI